MRTVDATGDGGGAGIGGGFAGNAKNIIIRGHSKVKATARDGAAIGGGSAGWGSYYGGSAKGIVIRDHATVVAKSDGGSWLGNGCAAIGAAGNKDTEAEVIIGTPGATAATGDVHVTATGSTLCHWQWHKRYQGHHSGQCDHPDGEHKKFHCDRK